MDVRSNEPFWLIKNSLLKSYPSLTENISTDVLIVGAGITGALTAYKLINEGKKIVMVDKRDVCNGSSAASTSMLQYEIDTPLHKLIEMRGLSCAVSSYRNCEQAIFDIKEISDAIKSECDFLFKKSVYYCNTKKGVDFLEKEFNCRKEHGFNVKWMEKEDLEKLGLNAYAAILSESGAIMDVYRLANDLLAYCCKKGLLIYDRTDIAKINPTKDGITAIAENDIIINCQHVVHCTGYESTNTLNEDIVDLKSTYAIVSESFKKLPNAFKNHIYWNTDEPYLYFRSTSDNRIIVGGEDDNFRNPQKRDAKLPKKEKTLAKKFRENFMEISFIPDYSWAGTFGETKDGLPYMGKPDPNKNEYYNLGFGGNGITFSVMGTEAIFKAIDNEPHPFLEYYKFGR